MNTMLEYEKYIQQIIDSLRQLDPYKIILFGSLATGDLHEDSDIDLLVVLNSDKISQNYEEKMSKKMLVRNAIWNISSQIPIDLLVYTRKEYEIIMTNKNSFFREIDSSGKILYEKAS